MVSLKNQKAISSLLIIIIISATVIVGVGAVAIYLWLIPGEVISEEMEYSDFTAVDVTGNEYPDILVACHRNDLGHQVDSLLFFNGPDGIDLKNPKYLPCLGPHGTVSRDFGNGKDRRPVEYYESEIKNIKGKRPKSINWKGEIPFGTQLKIQLRWGINREDIQENNWGGPLGEDTYYEVSGSEIKNVQNSVNFLQFRVLFISKNGCASPKLEEVSIEFS